MLFFSSACVNREARPITYEKRCFWQRKVYLYRTSLHQSTLQARFVSFGDEHYATKQVNNEYIICLKKDREF